MTFRKPLVIYSMKPLQTYCSDGFFEMANSTNASFPAESGFLVFIIAPFSILAMLINVFFFFLGVKTLKKTAHNMFVISMCGGDCIYGISLFILAFINKIGQAFSDLCISQIVLFFIAINMTLTVALLICVDRYITLQQNNFGIWVQSDKWKKKMAAISMTLTTGYVIICILVVPRQNNETKTCRFDRHYIPYHYRVIMALLSSLFAGMAVAIVVLYVIIVRALFQYKSLGRRVEPSYNLSHKPVPFEDICEVKKIDENCTQRSIRNQHVCSDLDIEHDEMESNCPSDKKTCESVSIASVSNVRTIHTINSTPFQSVKRNKETRTIAYIDTTSSTRISQFDSDTTDTVKMDHTNSPNEDRIMPEWKPLELRAFATSAYIIGSTLLLHGPLIVCLVTAAIGIFTPYTLGDLSAVLVALQCIIDPFLYAFRFQELRQTIKQIICCGQKNDKQMVTTGNEITITPKTEDNHG